MHSNDLAATSTPKVPHHWDEDAIFSALGHPVRRRLFLALGRNGPKPGSELSTTIKPQLGTTLKQLSLLIDAGLVVKHPNPNNGRQPLYTLAPAVPLTKTETGWVSDFGFLLLRF